MMRRRIALHAALCAAILLVVLVGLGRLSFPTAEAQPNFQVSPTPGVIDLPPATDAPEVPGLPTRTPTPAGPVMAEAADPEIGSNVRAGPDINAERLGVIFPGTQYPVTGVAAGTSWLRIRYPDSPNGIAWVFRDVVILNGDLDEVPVLSSEEILTSPLQAGTVVAEQTATVLAQTPGALETFAAENEADFLSEFGGGPNPDTSPLPQPTFTFPPGIEVAVRPTAIILPQANVAQDTSGFPPILPILGLAGLGILGLLVGLLRRLG